MKKRFGILTVIVVIILAAATTMAITAGYMRAKYDKVSENLQAQEKDFTKLAEINKLLRERYIGELDESALNDGIASGVINGLGDAYAKYYSVEDYARYKKEQQGKVVGIGISVIEDENGCMRIIRVIKDSPAADKGLKVGDVIVSIAGESTAEMGFVNACAALSGAEGTTAEFTIQRPTMTKKVNYTLERTVISVPSVDYEIIAGDVGYVRIYTFDATTLDGFNEAIDTLCERGVGAFVFDVRHNATGDIDVAAQVLDTLLPSGTIMSKIYADSEEPEVVTSDDASLDMPMAVVMDENTASAAELFACALSDYNLATTVGTTTFGKGTIQQLFPLSDRSAVSISVAYYYPPFSSNYEGVGVEPNVQATLTAEQKAKFYDMAKNEDPQIVAAVKTLGRSFESKD